MEEFKESLEQNTADFSVERFYSSDGKLTISVKASQKHDAAARQYAEAEFDRMLAKYGTKQAQAVREYRSEAPKNGYKNEALDPKNCKHENCVEKIAQTPKNAGRAFKTCLDCGAFAGWVPTHGIDKNI